MAALAVSVSFSAQAAEEMSDPYEGINRAVFAFNEKADDFVINPALTAYRFVVPHPARTGVSNFLFNLKAPVRFGNQLLQGDISGAGNELFRTIVNTFIGLGLFDVAAHEGYAAEHEDFGQTLGVWGVPHGPYMVVPLIGPSSMRDYVGYAVDGLADPLRLWAFNVDKSGRFYTIAISDYVNLRNELKDILDELEASSIDYYAAVRSSYLQARNAMVADQETNLGEQGSAAPSIPDYDFEDEDF
ncbi:MAG: VacJ family lipoprotein [Pseudomonadota bacterium]